MCIAPGRVISAKLLSWLWCIKYEGKVHPGVENSYHGWRQPEDKNILAAGGCPKAGELGALGAPRWERGHILAAPGSRSWPCPVAAKGILENHLENKVGSGDERNRAPLSPSGCP